MTLNRNTANRLAAELAGEEAGPGEPIRITVAGRSMAPALQPGDVLLVRPAGADSVRPGDIVTFLADDGPVTHRVLRVDGRVVLSKGDGARRLDPPFSAGQILGRVTAVERGARQIPPVSHRRRRWIARLSEIEGRYTAWFPMSAQNNVLVRAAGYPLRILIAAISG